MLRKAIVTAMGLTSQSQTPYPIQLNQTQWTPPLGGDIFNQVVFASSCSGMSFLSCECSLDEISTLTPKRRGAVKNHGHPNSGCYLSTPGAPSGH
ncbi:hypothetical protein [Vibrio mediterranei]|uniref:hypothetical protein n=1 Tax=Vibrio mediterranei TaxID=689 RepID=UPI00148CC2C8|nr:hypothetical protein [Vibrio mediterranei]